jgi:hypothetical protein
LSRATHLDQRSQRLTANPIDVPEQSEDMKLNRHCRLAASLAVLFVAVAAPVVAQSPFTLEKRATARHADRYGDLSLGAVIRTDERYGHDGLFQGPRGWDYWNLLESPKPYQDPNLWPDKRPTYFMAQMKMPPGTDLTIRGRFPHARYFKFALYVFERNTFVALREGSLASYDIEPDAGSGNPYITGADRDIKNRNYTIHVLTEDAPQNSSNRAKNTVYAGKQATEIQVGLSDLCVRRGLRRRGDRASRFSLFGRAALHLRGDACRRNSLDVGGSREAILAPARFGASAVERQRVVCPGKFETQRSQSDSRHCPGAQELAVRDFLRDEIHRGRRVRNAAGEGQD